MVFNDLKYYFINSNLALIIYIYFKNYKIRAYLSINDEKEKSINF